MPRTRRRDIALRESIDRINIKLSHNCDPHTFSHCIASEICTLTNSDVVSLFELDFSRPGHLEMTCCHKKKSEKNLESFCPPLFTEIAHLDIQFDQFLKQIIVERVPRTFSTESLTATTRYLNEHLSVEFIPANMNNILLLPLSYDHKTYGLLCLGSFAEPYALNLAPRLWPLTALLATKRTTTPFVEDLVYALDKKNAKTGLDELFVKLERHLELGLVEINTNHQITRFNPGAERIFGYPIQAMIDQAVTIIIPETFPNQHKIRTFSGVLLLQQQSLRAQILGKHACGHEIPLNLKIVQYNRNNQTMSLLMIEDLSEINTIREQQREEIQRFKAVADLAPVGILQTNAEWEAIYANNRWCEIAQVSQENVLGLGWVSSFYHDDIPTSLSQLREAINAHEEFSGECRFYSQLGNLTWVELLARPMINAKGELDGFLATLADCTYRHITEEKLRIIAERDTLTNLANRGLFIERLNHALQKTNRHGALALLCLDLDGFKNVNDTLGHDAGDCLLQAVARRLESCVRQEDTVARLGGDEFSILLEFIQSPGVAAEVATKVLRILDRPFVLQGQEVFISTSIGITFSTLVKNEYNKTSSANLLKQADIALYRAKAVGRNNFQYFSTDLEAASQQKMFLGNSLHRALERQEFEVYYQLQADMQNQDIVGSEALLRWHHPQKGLLPPLEFIDILEETGLILPVSHWLWCKVFRQHKSWIDQGLISKNSHISVNLSPRQLRDHTLTVSLLHEISEAKLKPHQVLVEITEAALIEDSPQTMKALNELRAAGVKIALDDFGTGYASLTYLKRFPIHYVKIDQSFIRDLLTDKDDAAITHAVVSLAHTLNLTVIAEGVDAPLKREQLAAWGCDQFQGFILNKPGNSSTVQKLLEEFIPKAS